MSNYAPYTAFGKTKLVPVVVYEGSKIVENATDWEKTLWVERGEDYYGIRPHIRTRVVTREDWLAAEECEPSTSEARHYKERYERALVDKARLEEKLKEGFAKIEKLRGKIGILQELLEGKLRGGN